MNRTNKQPHDPSILELLQEVHKRVSTEELEANQQQELLPMLSRILQAYSRNVKQPCIDQDLQQIRGQNHVKRALEVAAAGQHHLLLVGPSGAGKSLLARALPSLLPITSLPYPFRELSGEIGRNEFLGEPTSLGEVILSHGGVLFLKDLDTFNRSLLNALAQTVETRATPVPLEEGHALLPTQFLLEATIKPCPCGFYGDRARECWCSAEEIVRYRDSFNEIVRTCFALEVEVPPLVPEILSTSPGESSLAIRRRVEAARAIQQKRYAQEPSIQVNADLRSVDEVQRYCQIDDTGKRLLEAAFRQLNLTAQQILRFQAVARTIADLAESETISANHLAEAIQYRSRFAR